MADLGFLTRVPFAHRGLHGGGIVENSRAAWEAAVAAGHGVECDVQASADGVAMVFHDFKLDRLTGAKGRVAARDAGDLGGLPLGDSEETIPTLAEMVRLLAGRTPLLIEVKCRTTRVEAFCRSIAAALQGGRGEAAVMSFNPEIGRWFALNAPGVARGLVVTEQKERTFVKRLNGPTMRAISVFRASPQFLAYDILDLPSPFAAALRAEGMPVLTWTVRTPEEIARAREHADQIIYEPM